MQGIRVGRRTKIQTLRLSLVIERAGANDVRHLVATRMGLDAAKASVTDVLRKNRDQPNRPIASHE